jgi:hypothetical protein
VYVFAYTYVGNPSLEAVVRVHKTDDGSEENVKPQMRPLSLGDVVAVADTGSDGWARR